MEPEATALRIFVITYAVSDSPHKVALLECLRLLYKCLRAAAVEIREDTCALVNIGDLLGQCLLERVGLDLEDKSLFRVRVIDPLIDLLHHLNQQLLVSRAQRVE